MLSLSDYKEKIEKAKVYEILEPTNLDLVNNLSERYSNNIYLKREDLQKVFSFKIRGAFNKIASLTKEEREKGIVTASAGNHAQGVAFSGTYFSCNTCIVMPKTTPLIKIKAVKKLGATVVLEGDSFQESEAHARNLAEEKGFSFVHPYDDEEVIAGQGTIGKEILDQLSDIDAIFVPIGGGGIAAGIGAYVKSVNPSIKIIGVEPIEAASMHDSLIAKERIKLDWVGNFADGVAVKQVGVETFRVCQQVVDSVVLIHTDEICSAIKDGFEDTRVLLEPAGALAIAGAKKYIKLKKVENKNFVVIASGANVNFSRLSHVSERAQLGEKKEVILQVELGEKAGELQRFCQNLENHSISEFNYRYSDSKEAHIFVGISIENQSDKISLLSHLDECGVKYEDLTNSEMAKVHVRHLIGGKAPSLENERIVRFEFPERPGALMNFLEHLNSKWNITLFHYRSHGSDRGRVLIGLDVCNSDDLEFQEFLEELNYNYWDETQNIACKTFL